MANELQEKLDAILEDKNTNLLPEHLKAGVTCLGIEGAMQAGIDTSDATATAQDIVSPKTAYVNGEKLTGTIQERRNTQYLIPVSEATVKTENKTSELIMTAAVVNNGNSYVIDGSNELQASSSYEAVAEAIGLTADKIVSGNTVLGVEGTAEAGGSQYEEIKLSELQVGDNIIGIRVKGKPTEVTDESLPVFEEVQGEMNGLVWTSMYSDGEDSNRLYLMCNGMMGGTNYGGGSVLFKRVGTTWTALNDMELYILTSPMPIGYINPTDIPKLDGCISVIKVK